MYDVYYVPNHMAVSVPLCKFCSNAESPVFLCFHGKFHMSLFSLRKQIYIYFTADPGKKNELMEHCGERKASARQL